MKKRINWEEIKEKYICGIAKDKRLEFPTAQDLAQEYKISRETISRRSSKEGWAESREEYITERSQKGHKKVIEVISDKTADFDISIFDGVNELKRKILLKIDLVIPSETKPFDFVNLAIALKQIKEVEKSVLGEGTKGDKSLADELLALSGKNVNDR